MRRAQSIKAQWEGHRHLNDTVGRSPLNFGRVDLMTYIEYCYGQYKGLCFATGEQTQKIGAWLFMEVVQ
jgi:hypothetical protein